MWILGRMTAIACCLLWGVTVSAGSAQIEKMLPHFLDGQGRHTLSPSLYERDAYQAHLRRHPELRSGIRFDLLLRAPRSARLAVRLELRGSKANRPTEVKVDVPPFKHRGRRVWKAVVLSRTDYETLGELLAWRATLWDGDRLLTETKSFLW